VEFVGEVFVSARLGGRDICLLHQLGKMRLAQYHRVDTEIGV
jgi:hypothetical protein